MEPAEIEERQESSERAGVSDGGEGTGLLEALRDVSRTSAKREAERK